LSESATLKRHRLTAKLTFLYRIGASRAPGFCAG
jgi:hypothetical protein